MNNDEKLLEIAKLIENMFKKNGKFFTIDYSLECTDYATEDIVKTYLQKLQCLDISQVAKRERILYPRSGSFFIDFGLAIVKVIHKLLSG